MRAIEILTWKENLKSWGLWIGAKQDSNAREKNAVKVVDQLGVEYKTCQPWSKYENPKVIWIKAKISVRENQHKERLSCFYYSYYILKIIIESWVSCWVAKNSVSGSKHKALARYFPRTHYQMPSPRLYSY